jgi:hypothetical protein
MNKTQFWSRIAGGIFILAAIGFPSALLIELFHANPAGIGPHATLGILYLRIGVIFLGSLILLLGFYPTASHETPYIPITGRLRRIDWSILTAILLVATVLRFFGLDQQLWLDEIMMHVRYMNTGLDRILTTFDFNNHAFYSIQAKLSLFLAGDSPWALRLPAALFGIGSIGALFIFAHSTLGLRVAFFSSALLSVSYHHIWFSQNARGYTGLLLWTLISGFFFLRACEDPRRRFWVAYAISIALGLYTLDLTLVVLAGHFIMFLWRLVRRPSRPWPDRFAGLLFGFGLAGAIAFTLSALLLPQKLAFFKVIDHLHSSLAALSAAYDTPIAAAWKDPLWTAAETINVLQRGIEDMVILGGILVFGFGCWRLAREKREILGLFFIPVLFLVALDVSGSLVFPRFYFFAAGFAVLIMVSGLLSAADLLTRLVMRSDSKVAGNAAGLLAILVSSATVPAAYAPKQDYEGALRFIEGNRVSGDAVVAVSHTTVIPYRMHYGVDWVSAKSLEELRDIRTVASRTWLVYTLPKQLESRSPRLWNMIRESSTEEARFRGTLGGGDIVVCSFDKEEN